MPKRNNPWTYKKRKRSSKKTSTSKTSEEVVPEKTVPEEAVPEEAVPEAASSGAVSAPEEVASTESNQSQPNLMIKKEVQLTCSPGPRQYKRQSNALIASFGLLESQKPSDDPPVKIKTEPLNDVPKQTSTQVLEDSEVQIIGAFKPVKKVKVCNPVAMDTTEDIVIVTECIIEKESEDNLLNIINNVSENDSNMEVENVCIDDNVKKEELCDTAPSSPVSEEGEAPYHLSPEELELSRLSLTEPSNSPHSDSDEIVSEDTFHSFKKKFVGFNNLKFLNFDSKIQLVDIYNCSQILICIQNELKNKVPSNEGNFEESLKKSIRKFNSTCETTLNLKPVVRKEKLNTSVIPPPSFAPIKDISPPPNAMQNRCAATASTVFNNRQCARDLFLEELNVSPRSSPPSTESLYPKQSGTISENDIDSLLNCLKPTMKLLQSTSYNTGIQSLNKNDINEKDKNSQLEAFNAFSQENGFSIVEPLQPTPIFPPLPATSIYPPTPDAVNLPPLPTTIHSPIPDAVNLPPLPPTIHSPIPDTVSHTPLPNARISQNQIDIDIEPQTSVSYIEENSSLARQLQTSVFANEIPNLPNRALITNNEPPSLNDNMLRKRSYPYSESFESPSNQTDATNNEAPADPRKNRASEIPNKVPRYDAFDSGKPSQLITERGRNSGYIFKAAIAGIETNQTQLNKRHTTQNRTEDGKHSESERKKKINFKEYLNRKSSSSDKHSRLKTKPAVPNSLGELNRKSENLMSHTMKDAFIGRPIEVVTRRFSSENDPRSSSSVQSNITIRNSNDSLSDIPCRISSNQNSIYGNPIPVLNEKGLSLNAGTGYLTDTRNNLTSSSSPYECIATPSYNEFSTNNPPNRFPINYPNQAISIQSDLFGSDLNYTASNGFENIPRQTLLPSFGGNVRENVRIPILPTPLLHNHSIRSPQLSTAVSPPSASMYSSNSPTLMDINMHHLSSPQSSPNLALQQPTPVNFQSNPVSRFINATSSYRSSQRNFACLVPESVKEDIGKTFVQSSYVYLIMIAWSYDWLSEFERQRRPELNLPPILPKSVQLSQVRNTYNDERDYYNTYFKLLLFESWFKLYEAWKDRQRMVFQGTNFDYEQKNEFNKYVIECFVPTPQIEALPKESCIVLVTFKSLENAEIKMLGYVTKVVNRSFQPTHDSNHEAYKALSPLDKRENVYKFKVTIYTAFKVDDINDREMISIQHLLNVRKILQQNDALMNLSKSPLHQGVISPITSPNKFSACIPKESMDYASVMDQVSKRILDQEPLLAMVHTELPTHPRMQAVSYLIKTLKDNQPDAKIIICSKSENTLSDIAVSLKLHYPVFINKDRVSDLQKYSLARLIEKNMPKFKNTDTGLIEDEVKTKNIVRKNLLTQSDVILLLLLGLENDDYSVMRLVKDVNIACCILDEAHTCTEPESIIPLSYGIKKYVLLGNKNSLCKVSPYTNTYDFNRSLLNRASL